MPVVGTRKSTQMGRGYSKDPINSYAESFKNLAQDILNESGVDIFTEPQRAVIVKSANETLKNFFCENSIDRNEIGNDAEAYEDHMQTMNEQFLNDREALLEYAPTGSFNPVIGMTFPLHKNIMMNNIFDKGAIPKIVAREPKFTTTLETRNLITPDGKEIDMFKEQNKMMEAIDSAAPFTEVALTLPEAEKTDLLAKIGATTEDNISIESYISACKISVYLEVGDVNPETGVKATAAGAVDVWLPVKARFVPAYGEYDRTIMEKVSFKAKILDGSTVKVVTLTDVLAGYFKKNKIFMTSSTSVVKAVKFKARVDTSSAMIKTCSVAWKTRTDILEIPSAIPINTPISPDEVKDIGALYQTNQLTKIMSMFKLVLSNYKDDKIKSKLDESFLLMPDTNKISGTFDFAPREGYMLDHIEWRSKTFMDALDSYVTYMLQVLNDPNMTISVFGRPDLIRKITPTEYSYQTPSNIGPVALEFTKTVCTADKRVYQFISSDKLRDNNNLIIILCPRNTDRFIYRIYDYQMYVSNEIRNVSNYALPAIHAFERWLFSEYQPVQGRVKILNPTGLRTKVENTDPIGKSAMNDFTANDPEPVVTP